MDILSQLLMTETFKYFLEHWRMETMLIIMAILITYVIMLIPLNKYKNRCNLLQETLNTAFIQALKLYRILKESKEESDIELIKFYIKKYIDDSLKERKKIKNNKKYRN